MYVIHLLRDNERVLSCKMKYYALRYKQTIDHYVICLRAHHVKKESKKVQLRWNIYREIYEI